MYPEGLRPVWTRGPYPTRFAANMQIRRERMVLEEARRSRAHCLWLSRVRDTHTIMGLYRLDPGKQREPATYEVVCELHDTAQIIMGYFAARRLFCHPRTWCEPCSRIDVLNEGVVGGITPRPGFGPVFTGPLAKYG